MNIAENNYSAEFYPSTRSHAQYTTNHFPRHGPYTQSNMPPQYTNPSHTHPPYIHPAYNPTMRPVAEQGSIHYHYHSCQFVLVPYQTGQQPYPYIPPPAQPYPYPSQCGQPYPYPSQPAQPYFYFPQSEQQPNYSFPQQSATNAHQHQQDSSNSTIDPQHHRDAESPSPIRDSEDPDVLEIKHNLENQALP
ncbi:hypothetical protein AGABI1DRAFT_129702 [Agaricus bisporus var. burnettii JB137-S8]|uniref:Uncharacterized protein n=1 Tax=Agaricus bisporus var. burnettii (strain JB137-S8 / ATCC MYA-4627 / FGSC 10392) TaxID=597362 RepID=K5X4N8_AGABU|nr:uncharacterized protein AGABI1DRAFT_129702 [Agaricus bisporus var. burnettii JB137-S8]EKM77912.1 hypothetical protein AGABI1DRAFT_129702 [Agaricus bisporus var. burnettii JB137-S8]